MIPSSRDTGDMPIPMSGQRSHSEEPMGRTLRCSEPGAAWGEWCSRMSRSSPTYLRMMKTLNIIAALKMFIALKVKYQNSAEKIISKLQMKCVKI